MTWIKLNKIRKYQEQTEVISMFNKKNGPEEENEKKVNQNRKM